MRKKLWFTIILIFVNSLSYANGADKITAGWVEYAVIFPQQLGINAKLDTGARTSSISATDMEFFTNNEQQYVRFSLKNSLNKHVIFEYPVLRTAKIKRHFGQKQIRPVIRMKVCLGGRMRSNEVTLVDRTGFNYQLLLGRNFLANNFLVDSGKKNLLNEDCHN